MTLRALIGCLVIGLALVPGISGGSALLPNLTPYHPAIYGWSDAIVVSKSTGTSTDSSPLTPTDTLYVDWAVANVGTAPATALFWIALYVDGVLRRSWSFDPPMGAGFFTYFEDYSIGSLSPGTHTIRIVADSTGAIAESDEGDNDYTKTITVSGTSDIAGPYTGTYNAPAPGTFCPAAKGNWHGQIALNGTTLTIDTTDDHNGPLHVVTTLSGSTATWNTGTGSDAIGFTGTFTPGQVDGTFTGPTLCPNPYQGEFHGTRVGP